MDSGNKMIMVTGEPRSGTSLQMAFLRSQGIPIAGKKYPMADNINVDTEEGQRRLERSKELNPNGFWEVSGTVIHGIYDIPDKWSGHALKIVSSGAYPRWEDNREVGTPTDRYEKAIICVRNPHSVAKSQTQLWRGVETASDEEDWDRPRFVIDPSAYIDRTGSFMTWLADQSQEVKDKFHVVDFDDMVTAPEPTQKNIMQHLDRPYVPNDVVDPKLNRSEKQEWPEGKQDEGRLADKLYELTLSRDWEGILAWKVDKEDYSYTQRLEGVRWVDTEFETYRIIPASMWRSLEENNKGVRDKLLKNADFHDHTQSKYYEESDDSYTIERPPDIGDLTRNKVFCTHPQWRGEMTHERFRGLWIQWGRE